MKSFRFQVAEDSELDLVNAMELPDVNFEWFTKEGTTIKIKKGYAWDGASGPTIDTKDTIRASLIHDCYYQAMRLGLVHSEFRKAADKELRDQMIKAGCWKVRAWLWYFAVRLCAASSAKTGNLQGKEIKETV